MAESPTARTLRVLRAEGYTAGVVERWNHITKTRSDLFGILDIVGVHPKHGTIGVQATSGSNVAARLAKLEASEALPVLRAAGWQVEVWGWRKNAMGNWVHTRRVPGAVHSQ